jgi:hypothetical protein
MERTYSSAQQLRFEASRVSRWDGLYRSPASIVDSAWQNADDTMIDNGSPQDEDRILWTNYFFASLESVLTEYEVGNGVKKWFASRGFEG